MKPFSVMMIFITVLISLIFVQHTSSFIIVPTKLSSSSVLSTTRSQLFAGGLFGQNSNGNILSNMLNGNNNNNGATTVFTIPAKNVKIGALRFLLQIHLVSEQNKPQPKSWLVRQNDNNDSELDVYYTDGTGMFTIQLKDNGLSIQRYGSRPSLQYMLQESVLLHSVLDEIQYVVFGKPDDNTDDSTKIDSDKRLLVLQNNDAIDIARNALPARQQKL